MRLLIVFITIILAKGSNAQLAKSDSAWLLKSIQKEQSKFQDLVSTSAPLYNGISYIHYWNKVIGHPYFLADQFQPTEIQYLDYTYQGIPLKYDLLKDQLVMLNATKEFEMVLLNEHVSEFSINNHDFIAIKNDSIHSFNPGQGFYELLYHGRSSVIVKYLKRIEASLKAEDNNSRFAEYTYYYVFDGNEYHAVEGLTDFFNLHKEQKAELKKYLKKEKLSFSKNPAKTLVSLATYFDSLSHD
jgi:hypothetical protein